jgi:hypothetical protein
MRYDPDRAAQLLARMSEAPEACDDWLVVFGFDSITGLNYGGVFVGTLGPGEECGEGRDSKSILGATYCREGFLCLPDTDGVNRCVAMALPGDPCPVVPSNPGSSCHQRRPADPNGTFKSAEVDLVCVPDGPDTGTCEHDAPDGTPCEFHEQCESRFCRVSEESGVPGVCTRRLGNGEACIEPAACDGGRCDFAVDPPICAERSADGADCLIDEDCELGACRYEDETSAFGACHERRPALPTGAECGPNDTCEGVSLCADGVCLAPACTDFITGRLDAVSLRE